MTKRILICISAIWFSQFLFSQESDSLINIFNTSKNDSLRVDAILKLSPGFIISHPGSLFMYIEEAQQLAINNKLDRALPDLIRVKGQVY